MHRITCYTQLFSPHSAYKIPILHPAILFPIKFSLLLVYFCFSFLIVIQISDTLVLLTLFSRFLDLTAFLALSCLYSFSTVISANSLRKWVRIGSSVENCEKRWDCRTSCRKLLISERHKITESGKYFFLEKTLFSGVYLDGMWRLVSKFSDSAAIFMSLR